MAAEADPERPIPPSMVNDGLKPLQNKVLEAKFEIKQEETRRRPEKNSIGKKMSKAALMTRPKNTSVKPHKLFEGNLAGNDDDEDSEPKPEAQKKKPPKKANASVKDDEDLQDRLAVYDFDFSVKHSAMETETTEGGQKGKKGRAEPSKRGAAKKDKLAVEEVQAEKQAKGRKPAAEKPKKTTTRKRAPDPSNSSAPSPKKGGKVSKKVGSTPTATEDAEAPPASGSSDQAVAPRRSARLKQST